MCLDTNHAWLVRVRAAALGLLFALPGAETATAAPSAGLIDARDAADVGRLVLAEPAEAADTLAAAAALGLGDPAAVIFATLAPGAPPEQAAALTAAAATAAPGSADLFVAAALAASGARESVVMQESILRAAIGAVEASTLTASRKAEEVIEIVAAFSALIDPEILPRMAALAAELTAADDDAEMLLAALGEDVETGATRRRPFENAGPAADRTPFPLALPPQAEGRNAPSGN